MNQKVEYSTYNNFSKVHISSNPTDSFLTNSSVQFKLSNLQGKVVCIEVYPGVDKNNLRDVLLNQPSFDTIIDIESYLIDEDSMSNLLSPYLTCDRVFGKMCPLEIEDLYQINKINALKSIISNSDKRVLIYGFGASLIPYDTLIYVDISRWEIELRYRDGLKGFTSSKEEDLLRKFKRGYFIEWRIADRVKMKHFEKADYYIDANIINHYTMISRALYQKGLDYLSNHPFRLVPYYDPGIWGGQWMKKVCHLDPKEDNYAWSFNGVPEENALCFDIDGTDFVFPAMNLVLFRSIPLLGQKVVNQFGAEFPIRFDFLDTMGGGNLSLQVHPTKSYIKDTFGMEYTQDESYYILDAKDDASVYLGLKEEKKPTQLIEALEKADSSNSLFSDKDYLNQFPAKKHDHFLIPAGTIHCSGKNTMVLEISSTPYIFTFKLWDWGRLGLDGIPRPVHINHGKKVIQFDRTTNWVKKNLINRFERISNVEEKTGLHELEFIETRRFTFDKEIMTNTNESVNVLMVVEGSGVKVTPSQNQEDVFIVNYAECFIIPESVQSYTFEPLVPKEKCMVLKAYIRT